MNTFTWLLRREFWENKAIWMIPAAIGALLILAALFGNVELEAASPEQHRANVEMALLAIGAVFFAVMSLYSTWYLLDCLYADRRDRSILFWKSLPISDSATVLSKLFVALIAIPLVYFLIADLAAVLVAFIVALRTRFGLGAALWRPQLWLDLQSLWLYVIVSAALWYLPVAGWLMMISAWAKRAVILWSLLLPLAPILIERLFFGSDRIQRLLQERLFGYFGAAFRGAAPPAAQSTRLWDLLNPSGFLSSPATWAGVLVGAALLLGVVQLRMRRGEQ